MGILDDIGQGASPEKTDDQKPKPKQVDKEKKSKPKLKSIRQKEAEETPLEKLKRLETAKPIEIHESEPEQEFVSSLPKYDLPTKRDKTDLEQYDAPDKEEQQNIKPVVDEPSPDWEKLKAKPKNEKSPSKITLGKGNIPDTDQGEGLDLKKRQKSPFEDKKDSLKLEPFKKPLDEDAKSTDSLINQEPTKQLNTPEGQRDNTDEKPGVKKPFTKKGQKDDPKPKNKPHSLITTEEGQSPQKFKPTLKKKDNQGTIPEKISDEKPSPKQDPKKTKPKPKLKSIKQTEVEESPLEKLKRLENAKPIEMVESEPEEEFVSSLPIYDLPSKREKTDLEQYDTPEKEQQQRIKPVVDEPSPDWDRLKKKPESEEDPKKIILGKGDMPGKIFHEITTIIKFWKAVYAPILNSQL